jgi:uncharacterized protein YggE
MNRSTAFVLATCAILLVAFLEFRVHPAAGQRPEAEKKPKAAKHTIETSGKAVVRVDPNRARLYLRVQTTAATVKAAQADNAKRFKKALDAIEGLKIANLKMKSLNIEVAEIYSREKDNVQTTLPQVLGYQVTNSFTVLVSNDEAMKLGLEASRVLGAALENGATAAQSVEFFRDDMSDVRRQALTRATEDALANADALARGAKRQVTDVVKIDEPEYLASGNWALSNTMQMNPGFGGAGGGESDTPTLMAGEMLLTCRVRVTCNYSEGAVR